jgi:gliding motility-associated-like protein
MPLRLYIYCLFCLLCLDAHAQWGPPIIYQDFGLGVENLHVKGKPLAPGLTDLSYSDTLCPTPGSYTLARAVNFGSCFSHQWIDLSSDATSDWIFGQDLSYMMMVNNNGSTKPVTVYKDTTRVALCPGSNLEFRVSLIDLDVKKDCLPGPSLPVFEMDVEDAATGIKVASQLIGPLPFASPYPKYTFGNYPLNFVMPAGVNRLVIKLVLLPLPGYNDCGGDFAVDDIMLRSTGPAVRITLDNYPVNSTTGSVCSHKNDSISLTGQMDAYYPSPLLQWQQSADSGATWTDIAGATGNQYTKNFLGLPGSFLYRLSGSDASMMANPACRVVSNVIKVNSEDKPTGYSLSSNSPVCAGQDLIFNVTGGATYEWFGPNGFYDNVFYAHIYHSKTTNSGTYYVNVTTLGGCVARDSINALVLGVDSVFAGPDTAICKGRTVQLRVKAEAVSYRWSPAIGLSDTASQRPVAKPGHTTAYTVTVKDKNGCSNSDTAIITVLNTAEVKAMITATDNLCRYYDSASFKDASDGNIVSWNWNFGNGQTSKAAHPPEQFYSIVNNEPAFVARLTVKDSTGCADSAYHVLTVAGNCFIAVPSAFTPNGDGENDYLYPLNAYKATDLTFRVFNRNGQLVFETRDWTRKWNGTVNGQPQPPGAYVWMLSYTDPAHKRISLKGTSVLIR